MREKPLTRAYALVCPQTGAGIRFSPAPWPGLPEQVLVESRKRPGAWGRNGIVSQQRARELWRQHREKGWQPERGELMETRRTNIKHWMVSEYNTALQKARRQGTMGNRRASAAIEGLRKSFRLDPWIPVKYHRKTNSRKSG